jgi:hypothetical protein
MLCPCKFSDSRGGAFSITLIIGIVDRISLVHENSCTIYENIFLTIDGTRYVDIICREWAHSISCYRIDVAMIKIA